MLNANSVLSFSDESIRPVWVLDKNWGLLNVLMYEVYFASVGLNEINNSLKCPEAYIRSFSRGKRARICWRMCIMIEGNNATVRFLVNIGT